MVRTIWYTDGSKTTKSTGARCHAKGEGNDNVRKLGSMVTVFQAECVGHLGMPWWIQ